MSQHPPGLRSLHILQAVAAADERFQELGGDAAEEEHSAHSPGRVAHLPLAQGSCPDDFQGTLLLRGRSVWDHLRHGAHGALCKGGDRDGGTVSSGASPNQQLWASELFNKAWDSENNNYRMSSPFLSTS